MCWWQVWNVGDRYYLCFGDSRAPTSRKTSTRYWSCDHNGRPIIYRLCSRHHKVTNKRCYQKVTNKRCHQKVTNKRCYQIHLENIIIFEMLTEMNLTTGFNINISINCHLISTENRKRFYKIHIHCIIQSVCMHRKRIPQYYIR